MNTDTSGKADSGRWLVIGMTCALPLAAWLGLEYGKEPGRTINPAPRTVAPHAASLPDSTPPAANATAASAGTIQPPGLYRCDSSNQTVYTDAPNTHCGDAQARPVGSGNS